MLLKTIFRAMGLLAYTSDQKILKKVSIKHNDCLGFVRYFIFSLSETFFRLNLKAEGVWFAHSK